MMQIKSKQRKRELIVEYEASGQTVQAWCNSKGIPHATFYGWRRKEKNKNAVPEPGGWVQIKSTTDKSTTDKSTYLPAIYKEPTAITNATDPVVSLPAPQSSIQTKPVRNNADIIKIAKNGWTITTHVTVDKTALLAVMQAVTVC